MEFDDYPVPQRSRAELEDLAMKWRSELNSFFFTTRIDVLELFGAANTALKRPVEIEVRPDEAMGRANAYVSRDRRKVYVRQGLIEGALSGDPHSIFDAVHELGHIVLHPASVPLARMIDGNEVYKHIHEEESAEWQANCFARAFLMSLDEVARFSSDEELAAECNTPLPHARLRRIEVKRLSLGKRSLDKEAIGYNRLVASTSAKLAYKSVLPTEVAKRVAWETAPMHAGHDAAEYRCVDKRWVIRWSRFDMEMPGGWRLENGQIVVWEEKHSC